MFKRWRDDINIVSLWIKLWQNQTVAITFNPAFVFIEYLYLITSNFDYFFAEYPRVRALLYRA